MANSIDALRAQGQSVWLDYISRDLLTSGRLAEMVEKKWVRGVTSNPTIFRKAIEGSRDYDESLKRWGGNGVSPYDVFLQVGGEDIRMATDTLRPVYDDAKGHDGFVSFEAQPADAATMVAEAHHMAEVVGRPNLMIKIPGVRSGVEAVEQLISDGLNVNITLLFDVSTYEQFAEAYQRGLERRLDAGQDVSRVSSVASFFVSRMDTKVDERLPAGSPLRGRIAVANARRAYARFKEHFSGPRWQRLAAAGAAVQRPLWASTSTKNPAYSDVLYVEELVARDTVNTLPEPTLEAFLDHGRVRPAIDEGMAEAEDVLTQATAAGIDLKQVTDELLEEGLAAFGKDFEALLGAIGAASGAARV